MMQKRGFGRVPRLFFMVGDMKEYGKAAWEAALRTKKMGHPFYFYPETDSTNERIRALAAEGAPEGTLALAERQTAGRGRRGRAWQAEAGDGIWMSLLLRPQIAPENASVLTLLAGLALAEALTEETGLRLGLKWPNDILLNGKKLVGILTEMELAEGEIRSVTVGMGINVGTRAFPQELRQIATSLFLESGREWDRAALAAAILAKFEEKYAAFLAAGGSFAPFRAAYLEKCLHIGREIRVMGQESYLARALDITPAGELLVKRKDTGREEIVFSGEVSIRGEEL